MRTASASIAGWRKATGNEAGIAKAKAAKSRFPHFGDTGSALVAGVVTQFGWLSEKKAMARDGDGARKRWRGGKRLRCSRKVAR